MFRNRARELEALERAIPREGSSLFVLYGRRRVGKTELLKHFFQTTSRPHVFFTGDLGSATEHVRTLSRRLGASWNDLFLQRQPLSDWRALIEYIDSRAAPLDLILDEFPYLCDADPAVPSLFQNAWDSGWKSRDVRLVLCGSSVGFMEREVLGERSPLFGRRTAQMRLEPMDFWSARDFVEQYSPSSQVESYACFGGTPAYLEKLDTRHSLPENILTRVLDPVSYLHEEPRLMLAQELREPRNYYAILTSVAAGNTRLNDIVQDCGLERGLVSRYLDTLIRLDLVGREVPVTETDPARSRRGLYQVRDPFFRFWFRFVHPNLSDLSLHDGQGVLDGIVLQEMSHFVSPVFEKLCAEWIRRRAAHGDLGFRPARCGRWWDGRTEIDVLAFDAHTALIGECKWSTRPVGRPVLDDLEARGNKIPGLDHRARRYVLFSRAGFHDLEPRDDLLLVDLATLVEDRMPHAHWP